MSDGSEGPPPLRSQEFLLGLPDLSYTNLAKVTSANSLYQRAELLIEHLEKLGITWTVENPTNSVLWGLPFLAFTMAISLSCLCLWGKEKEAHHVFVEQRCFSRNVPFL